MIRYEDQCVGCPHEIGCLGSSCPYVHVPLLICDACGEEVYELYWVDGEQLCKECVLKQFEMVDLDEYE